ncbi:MAG: PEP-CTERM sorting domain-containing protein [Armatimonadetes bacterium]|nr:PEP-CTERM sorting domain-containing protein [Armatimonadota bacterium]
MKRGTFVAALAAILTAVGFADIKYVGLYATQTVKITFNGSNNSWNDSNVTAGKLKFEDPTNACGLGTSFQTVCVDLDHYLDGNFFSVDCQSTFGMGGGIEMAGKIARAFFSAAGNNSANSAALQVAVWEAVYDGVANGGVADFSSGAFKCSSASILAQATAYYAAASNPTGNSLLLKPVPQGSRGQAQITPVPEPASFAVLGLGLLAATRRKRK